MMDEPVSMNATAIKLTLTPAQCSAVGIYIVSTNECLDEDERIAGIILNGRTLTLDMTADVARDLLMESINSADVGDGRTPDRGSRLALENVMSKLRTAVS